MGKQETDEEHGETEKIMRIGMIFSTPFPPREGIGNYVWNLSHWLALQGHQVHLITRGNFHAESYQTDEGICVWKPRFFPCYPFHVHSHGIFVNQLVQYLEDELDLLHLHSPLVKTPQTTLPIITTIHTPIKADSRSVRVKDVFSLLIKLQTPFSIAIETELIRKSQRLTTVSQSVREELKEYGIPTNRVAVLGNGVNTNLFQPAKQEEASAQYVLTVSRLAPRKGLEDLIHCAKIVHKYAPNLRFIILGEGPLKSSLQKMTAQLGLEGTICFRGHVQDRAELVSFYQNCTVYAHPSHYEGLPTSLLEAMACSRPVVATAVSGNLDVIENGVNGLLVSPRQPGQLASAIISIVTQSEIARKIGEAARRTVTERYSWDIIVPKYLAEYQALLKDHRNERS